MYNEMYYPVSSGHHLCVVALGQACVVNLVDSTTQECVATLTGPIQAVQAMEGGLAKYYPRVVDGKLTLAVISRRHGSYRLAATRMSLHPDWLQSSLKDSMTADLYGGQWSRPTPL